jgi:CHASE1-domain containing sensor protein
MAKTERKPAKKLGGGDGETKAAKFTRLAEARTSAALKRIELLGNLAGGSYAFDPDQAQQILDAMFDAVHDLKRKFEKAKAKKSGKKGFVFKPSSPTHAAQI